MIDKPWNFSNLDLDKIEAGEIQAVVDCISNTRAPKTPLFENLEE